MALGFPAQLGFRQLAFLLMNPGNGIETADRPNLLQSIPPFLLMNPGNGIETFYKSLQQQKLLDFPINESWQRD